MVTCFQVIREVQLRSLIGLHGKKLNHEEHEEHEDEKAPKSEGAAFYVFTVFIEYFLLLRALRALRGSIFYCRQSRADEKISTACFDAFGRRCRLFWVRHENATNISC